MVREAQPFWEAPLASLDAGQWEAARSTGMRYDQAMRHVVFPQAFRRIIPPVTGQFVSLIKDSSLTIRCWRMSAASASL